MKRFDAREQGYRMPAEWEAQHSTWLGWPMRQGRETLWGGCEDAGRSRRGYPAHHRERSAPSSSRWPDSRLC